MISCVITTYKREPEILARALCSVLAQTYQDIEILVVNDAPQETELEARVRAKVESFGEGRIRYLLHECNRGAGAARNTGAAAAKGEFLAFLDDDDEWLPEKLEEQLKLMADPEVGLVSCEQYRVSKTGEKEYVKRKWPTGFDSDFEVLLTGNWLGGASFPLIRTLAFVEAGGFDEAMQSNEESELWIRISRIAKVAICYKPLLNYYISGDSISANIPAKVQGFEWTLSKHAEDFRKYPKAYRSRLLWLVNAFMFFGKPRIALHYFKMAVRNGTGHRRAFRYAYRGWRSRRKALKENRMW